MNNRAGVALAAAVGGLLGFAAAIAIASSGTGVSEAVRIALIGLAGGALGTISGALIGAYSATLIAERAAGESAASRAEVAASAEADRAAADRRIRDEQTVRRRLELFSRLTVGADQHEHEVMTQVAWWQGAAGDPVNNASEPPTVGSTDPLKFLVGELYFVAEEVTAERAWDLYRSLVELDKHTFDAKKHVNGGVIADLDGSAYDDVMDQSQRVGRARFRFAQSARQELGQPPLDPSKMPTPVDDDEPEDEPADWADPDTPEIELEPLDPRAYE